MIVTYQAVLRLNLDRQLQRLGFLALDGGASQFLVKGLERPETARQINSLRPHDHLRRPRAHQVFGHVGQPMAEASDNQGGGG